METTSALIYPDDRTQSPKIWETSSPFAENLSAPLDRLYKNVFCSAIRCVDADSADRTHALVMENKQKIEQIILFNRTGNAVTVLNEQITLPQDDVQRFVTYIFENYQSVDLVTFPSVQTGIVELSRPIQRFNSTEDIVAQLPDSPDQYLKSLSKNTRENIRRYQRRIAKDNPEIGYRVYERNSITPAIVHEIVELSKARLKQKKQIPNHTEQTIRKMLPLISKYGVALVAEKEGKICGGILCTLIYDQMYMHIIAHDPSLDHLRLGKICCFLSICDAIKRQCRHYHMLSGEYDYKFQFLGERFDYDRLTLYRSKSSIVKNVRTYIRNEIRGRGRKLKRNLRNWRRTWSR